MAKPLKTLAELKAETLAELEREKEEHRIAEEKKKAAAAAKAKENKEKDLIGANDSAKLNPVIEKVPAKTSTKTNLGTSKQAASDVIAKAAGAQGGIDKIEAAKVEKATAQAKKNKEKDLPGFDGYAYQRQLAEQKEAERLEYLNIKEARDKKSLLEKQLEQLKAQAKAETAKAGTVQIVSSGINSGKNSFVSAETQRKIDDLEKQISDLNKDITLADRSQSGKYLYNRATSAADFEEFSKEQAKEEKTINPHQQNIQRETETVKGYMNENEKAVYNYYLNKFGKEKAEEYFDSIREELNYRQAQAIFAGNEGKVLNEYIQGAAAGLESAKAGYKGTINMLLGIDEPQPTSTFDYVSQMAREDLAETGFKLPEALGGSSIGQIGFDYVSTYANMLPSMMLGTLGGGAVGAVAIGASAAGNAYNSAIKEGYSEEQARNYAALVGGSEASLGYLLGGIKSTGGKISNAVLGKLLPKIDSALAKAAVNVGGKYLSEMGEEYLQEILTPVFGNIALMEENEIDLLSPEAIYSGILGGLSAAGIAVFDGSANVPEVFEKAEVPVPFDGKAQPGTEVALVADKITEIENRPISEAEKAAKMEEVMEKAAQLGTEPGLVEEAEKIKNYHVERQAEFDEAVEIGKKLGISVELDSNIAGNGIHTSDGRIIINPNTENPALQVFVHELTHDIETSGLYADFSEKILSHVSENYDVDKIRRMVIEDYKAAGHNLTDAQADAEIVAKYCEQHLFTDEKAIQRLLDTDRNLFQKIKDWIHDMIVKFKGAPEERFLLEAERLYEKALATRGEVAGTGVEQHSYDYSKPFEQQIDDWKAGKIPAYDTLIVGATPKVFQDVGFNALPMTISQKHIDYALNGTKGANHFYGADIKKLPQALENPVAIISSKTQKGTSVVALVNLPVNGMETIVPVYVDGFGTQNTLMIDSNAITSVHGRNNTAQLLADAINDNAAGNTSVFYYNKKEAQSLLHQAGLQLPGRVIPRDGFNHSIRENGSSVKPKMDNVTESLQFKRWFGDWQKHPQNASKVVNQDGTPKVVYHGTFNDFWTFDINKSSSINDLGKGIYFSSDYNDAKNNYANKEGADILPRLEGLAYDYFFEMGHSEEDLYGNDYIDDYNKAWEMAEADYSEDKSRVLGVYLDIKNPVYVVEGGITGNHYEDINGNILNIDINDAQKLGYDGIIDKTVSEKFPGAGLNADSTHYVVFKPSQIKSATDNIGTFDPQNPDIRYSTGRGFDEMAEEAKTTSMERADAKLGAEDWKHIAESIDVETGIWRMKDLARVLDSAAGGNKILRQQLYELYEKPLNEAQGAYAANYEAKAKEISDKFKELGIKAGSNESAAVQRIGEGVKEIDKNGNTVPYTLDDLKKEFPDSWEKIKAGTDFCREIYDEFLLDLNAMYSEIYPATIEQANERVSNYDVRILSDSKKIGNIKEVRNNLEMDIIRKTAELSKKRPNTLVYAEIQNQIENAKRRIEKANSIIEKLENRKLTKEIARDTLKAQIENGEILQNKQIRPRADYFRHFQELTNEFAEIADIFSNDQRIPPNLAGKSETTKPRTIWTSIAQKRGKNYYTEDAVGGLLRYTEIAEKLLAYDPLISHFRDVNSAIRAAGTMVENEVSGKGTNAGQFAAWADDITNQLAGKTNKIDRLVADNTGALGRATIKAVEALNRRVKSNAILGNFRSALVQIGNLPNATLYIQNPIDWRNGVVSTISSVTGHSPEIKEARNNSNFMNRRYMGDSIDEITKEIQQNKILDKLKEFAIWMLGAGDRAAAEIIWHTAYTRALRNPEVLSSQKGQREYDSAVDYADDITRRSIGGRAEGDIPYFEESKITGLLAPFQIEVANTFNAFSEQLGKKNAAGIVAFEISVFLLNTVLEGITGDRPLGLDFIDAALDIIKEATGDEEDKEEKDLWDIIIYAGGRIGGEVLSSMPFGTQIGSALTGGDEQKAEDWFGDSDPTRYGTGNIGMGALADAVDYFREGETPEKFYDLITDGKKNSYSEWAKPVLNTVDTFAPLVMPWGGKQLSRTLGGLDQIIQGGAYGMENDGSEYLKFPQEYDPESIIKTVLFGQYASDRGQNYIDSGFKDKLSAKQTEQMELAEEYGLSKEEFYDVILGLKPYSKKEDKQKALLDNQDLDAGTKEIIDMILFGKPSVRAAELGYVEPTRSYASTEDFYLSGLSEGDRRLAEQDFSDGEIKKINNAINKGENKGESIANIQKAMDCTEAEAYEIYSRRAGTWVEELSGDDLARANGAADFYGMSTDDYLAVLNYSKFGTVVADENGEESYSTKMEDVLPKIMEATGWDEETAKKNYLMVNKYEYGREDIEEAQTFDLDTSQSWYEVEDKGYFVARNVLKTVEGTKDEYGNTVSGSKKEAAIKEISKQLGIDEEEATIYYLAANGDLVLSEDDLSSPQIEDMKAAVAEGWTERQFLDAVNVVKLSGATKKDDIIKALQDAGATYEMAQGYYNLKENADYDRFVGKVTYKYGVQKKKQEVKCDYFLENYNGDGSVTAKDMANWFAAGAGCKKKQEYIDAYMSAGATYSQALKFYSLMQGHDDDFNAWYKENGG